MKKLNSLFVFLIVLISFSSCSNNSTESDQNSETIVAVSKKSSAESLNFKFKSFDIPANVQFPEVVERDRLWNVKKDLEMEAWITKKNHETEIWKEKERCELDYWKKRQNDFNSNCLSLLKSQDSNLYLLYLEAKYYNKVSEFTHSNQENPLMKEFQDCEEGFDTTRKEGYKYVDTEYKKYMKQTDEWYQSSKKEIDEWYQSLK